MGKIINTNSLQLTKFKHWKSKWYHESNLTQRSLEDWTINTYISTSLDRMGLIYSMPIIKRSKTGLLILVNLLDHEKVGTLKIQDASKTIVHNTQRLLKQPVNLILRKLNSPDAHMVAMQIKQYIRNGKSLNYAFGKILVDLKNRSSIKGIRIECSGRPKKADMAKTEWTKFGQIPLHNQNKPIDYAYTTCVLKYGKYGIKVWLSKEKSKK